MSDLDYIRWHCRRGSLELDLILQKFAVAHLARLDTVQLHAFRALLECEDHALLDMIEGRAQAAMPAQQELLQQMRP